MFRVTSFVDFICTRTLDFFDNQASFDNMFRFNHIILIITTRSSYTIEEFDTLRLRILKLCSLYQLHICFDIIQV